MADVVSLGASGVMNEHKLSTDCKPPLCSGQPAPWQYSYRFIANVRQTSFVDGSSSRFASYDQPIPRPNAKTPGRNRPQLWRQHHVRRFTAFPTAPALYIQITPLTRIRSTNLAYLHPRLLPTVILLDPVIQLTPPNMGFGFEPTSAINFTLYRTDIWPNRKAAVVVQSRLTPGWDPQCFELMVKYGFQDLPTALYPKLPADADPKDPPVTLTTTKHQDVLAQIRENFDARLPDGRIWIDRSTHADMDPLAAFVPLYRPEPRSTFLTLPTLRPSVLFLLGGNTFLKLDGMREGI